MIKLQEKYFENLDGLRFLCFLSVFTVHTLHTDNSEIQSNLIYRIIVRGFFANGGIGVNFFFVLSGFLITYLLIKEKQTTGHIKIVNFWIKRILRIWPLYFCCVFFGFVIFPYLKTIFGQNAMESADLSLYMIFLANFNILWNGWPNSTELGILWSISIEEQFYLVWPIALSIFPIKRYWIIFFGTILGSLIFRAFNDDKIVYYYHTLSCISDMAVGGLGAWLMIFRGARDWVVKLSVKSILFVYLGFFVLYVFKEPLLTEVFFFRVIERLVISILIILIILEQNYSVKSFYKMKNAKILSSLGLTTYGMYMIHVIAFSSIAILCQKLNLSDNIFIIIIAMPALSLILTIILSKLSFNYFELAFIKLRKYLR